MRVKIIAVVAALLAVFALSAQDADQKQELLPGLKRTRPDMEQIKREINDPQSPYYYPRLMEEYQRNDTLMKLDKFRHLYLGYLFQEDYTPYRSSEHPLAYTAPDAPTREDCNEIIEKAREALADNPFDLRQMMLMINALRTRGNNALASIWQYKLNWILMAIVSTGTGLDEENAWVVIEPQHEYVLLNMLDYLVDDHVFYDPGYEYITVTDADGRKLGGYYFDIRNLLEEYYRKHPEEVE